MCHIKFWKVPIYSVQYLKRIIKGVFPANIGRINVQMGEYRDIDKEEGFKNE
jgi:hypothetical protein